MTPSETGITTPLYRRGNWHSGRVNDSPKSHRIEINIWICNPAHGSQECGLEQWKSLCFCVKLSYRCEDQTSILASLARGHLFHAQSRQQWLFSLLTKVNFTKNKLLFVQILFLGLQIKLNFFFFFKAKQDSYFWIKACQIKIFS